MVVECDNEKEKDKVEIYCKQFNILIKANTLGQAFVKLGNRLKRLKVAEIKRGLE